MEIDAPLITIVIPVLNRGELLPRTLNSILKQSTTAFNIVIVDNGSTDNTSDVIKRWIPRFQKLGIKASAIFEPRIGVSTARNRGLKEVKTPFVLFFDSDDEMLPDHIATLNSELSLRPEIDLLWFDIKEQDEDGWSKVKSVNDYNPIRGHLLHSTLATVRFIVRTDIIKRIGGFDESLNAWEDLELGVRLLTSCNKSSKLYSEPKVIVHTHPDSITGTSFSSKSAMLEHALDLCEDALKRSGHENEIIWVNVKRMVLSGLYTREKETKLATRLSDKVLDNMPTVRNRLILGFVRDTIAYFGRGGCALATALIKSAKPVD